MRFATAALTSLVGAFSLGLVVSCSGNGAAPGGQAGSSAGGFAGTTTGGVGGGGVGGGHIPSNGGGGGPSASGGGGGVAASGGAGAAGAGGITGVGGIMAGAGGGGISGAAGAGGQAGSEADQRSAAAASCSAYCEKLQTCNMPLYGSTDACKSAECDQVTFIDALCLSSAKAYYDCGRALGDICPGARAGCQDAYWTYTNCLQGIGTVQCPAPPPPADCPDPQGDACLSPAVDYECDTLRGTWRCPQNAVPKTQLDCSHDKPCTGSRPTGLCISSLDDPCHYHDPVTYECDHSTGQWACPYGSSPLIPTTCTGSGGVSGTAGQSG